MCDPMTAAALALSAGGSYLEQREQQKNLNRQTAARNEVYQRKMNDQARMADEAGAAFRHNTQQQGREGFDEKLQQESDDRMQAFNDRKIETDYGNSLRSTPKNVVLNQQRETEKAQSESDRDASNLFKLSGYNGAMVNQGLDRNEWARNFGNLQDKAQSQMNLLPLEMQAASHNASKSPSLFPTLMKAAGTGLGMYSAAGGFGAAGNQKIEFIDKINPKLGSEISYAQSGGFGPFRF